MEVCPLGTEHPPSRYTVFTDESCQTAHRYMVIGGVSASNSAIDTMVNEIEAIRANSRFPSDSLQWKNVTSAKLPDYYRLVDQFCEWNSEHALDFTAATFDTRRIDHDAFNEGDSEVGYQKFLGDVFIAIARKYAWPEMIKCYHGQRSSKFTLEFIREVLNSRVAKKKKFTYRPFRILEYRDPAIDAMLQLNDVLLGSVAYHWNPGMRKSPDSAKAHLARYINKNCCAPFLGRSTPFSMQHFDIWEFNLR